MATFPSRTAHTYWQNEAPISDLNEAIELLALDSSSTEPVHLALSPSETGQEWEIIVPWYREGSSGNDSSGEDYYQIDASVSRKLIDDRMVTPHKVLYLGGSYEDIERLVLVPELRAAIPKRTKELIEHAASLLTPGVHMDLASTPQRTGYGREHRQYGKFYVDFETPLGNTCRVYPEENSIFEHAN